MGHRRLCHMEAWMVAWTCRDPPTCLPRALGESFAPCRMPYASVGLLSPAEGKRHTGLLQALSFNGRAVRADASGPKRVLRPPVCVADMCHSISPLPHLPGPALHLVQSPQGLVTWPPRQSIRAGSRGSTRAAWLPRGPGSTRGTGPCRALGLPAWPGEATCRLTSGTGIG